MLTASAPRDEDTGRAPKGADEGWVEAVRALRHDVETGFNAADGEPIEAGEDRRGPFRPGRLTPVRARVELRQLTRLYRAIDATVVTVLAALTIQLTTSGGLPAATVAGIAPLVLGVSLLITALGATGVYVFGQREGVARHLARVSAAFGVTGAPLALMLLLPISRAVIEPMVGWFCVSFAALCVLNVGWWTTVRGWRRRGKLTPNIVIVGATEAARKLIETALKTREVAVLGVFDDRIGRAPRSVGGVPVLGDIADLLGHKVMPYVDRVVIAVNPTAQNRVSELIERLRVLPNEVSLVMDSGGEDSRLRALSRIADAQLAQVSGEPADLRKASVKRVQDLVLASTALLFGWPVLALVALAVKLDSPGPVFFRQRRHGFNNEEILVWKFRSMRQEAADATASQQVQAGDNRVTRVGRFIRKTSLDELPQLFNVVAGEMSLVGPRPHAIGMKTGETESARLVAEYAHRHRMKPGLTGWAAINGSRGPVDTPELVQRRVALDIDYIERQSFWFDLYIMAMTIPCLLGDKDTVR
ncbi:MAG: exopolysaccharide biosynthesis polyprenyl glycosylphosphotransferase [Pseudomonadota bacterium]